MKHAYDFKNLHNLIVIKESKRWLKQNLIDDDQFKSIEQAYTCVFYHPNFFIRILLFIATLFCCAAVTGLFVLSLVESSMEEHNLAVLCLIYGLLNFLLLDLIVIGSNRHYKSGVTEALLYIACGFTVGGISWMADYNTYTIFISSFVVTTFAAWRYLDMVCTVAAIGSLACLLFTTCFKAGVVLQQVIPFIFIICFGLVYAFARTLEAREGLRWWSSIIMIVEASSLLLVYAAGNYLVVREMKGEIGNGVLSEGQDIPFAFVFYALTILFPFALLYLAIKTKNVVALRVSLFALAFSVFTFKYYYGFGHPEISLTVAGVVLLGISLWLFRYLKEMRAGFTRENLLAEKWGNVNLQAFVMSQTLGGNQTNVGNQNDTAGGGQFGGGGSTDSF